MVVTEARDKPMDMLDRVAYREDHRSDTIKGLSIEWMNLLMQQDHLESKFKIIQELMEKRLKKEGWID